MGRVAYVLDGAALTVTGWELIRVVYDDGTAPESSDGLRRTAEMNFTAFGRQAA
jgi:hypothetical protein